MIRRAARHALIAFVLSASAAGCYADTTNAHSPGGISFQYRTYDYPAAFASGYHAAPAGAPSAVGGGPGAGAPREHERRGR